MKMTVFWDVRLCRLADIDRRFGEAYASIIRVIRLNDGVIKLL
jgi:hypothetical protein